MQINIEKLNVYKYKLAIFTDRVDFIDSINEADVEKLLEIRAFDESSELKYIRSTVDAEFKGRELNDADKLYFDETYYLDIDTAKTSVDDTLLKTAIGGGKYHLPEDKKMLKVRYYYKYDDNGIAKKYDWRLLGFSDNEDNKWKRRES